MHQIGIEKDELANSPNEEREELALIYQAKGVDAAQAQRMADHLLSDPADARYAGSVIAAWAMRYIAPPGNADAPEAGSTKKP